MRVGVLRHERDERAGELGRLLEWCVRVQQRVGVEWRHDRHVLVNVDRLGCRLRLHWLGRGLLGGALLLGQLALLFAPFAGRQHGVVRRALSVDAVVVHVEVDLQWSDSSLLSTATLMAHLAAL